MRRWWCLRKIGKAWIDLRVHWAFFFFGLVWFCLVLFCFTCQKLHEASLSLSELLLRCVILALGHPDLCQIQLNLMKSRLSTATPGALWCISSWGSGALLALSVDLGVSPHSSQKMLNSPMCDQQCNCHLLIWCVNPLFLLLLPGNLMNCSWLLHAYKFIAITLESDIGAVIGLSSLAFQTHFYCSALLSSTAELPNVFNNTLVRSLCKSGKH